MHEQLYRVAQEVSALTDTVGDLWLRLDAISQLDFCRSVRRRIVRRSLHGSWPCPPFRPPAPRRPGWGPVMTATVLSTPGYESGCENPTVPIGHGVRT